MLSSTWSSCYVVVMYMLIYEDISLKTKTGKCIDCTTEYQWYTQE